MEELDYLGNLGKFLGLIPSENYLPLLLVLPLFISVFTEFLKTCLKTIKKQNELSPDLKSNIQIIVSFLVAVLILYVLYGNNTSIKNLMSKSIYFTIILAKLSSYCYKGLPLINAIPGLKNIKLETIFKAVENSMLEAKQQKDIQKQAKEAGGYG